MHAPCAGLWGYFNFNWYTHVINRGYKTPLQTEDLPVLIDHDRAARVWSVFSRILYKRGEGNVQHGEHLAIGKAVMQMSGQRLYLQVM